MQFRFDGQPVPFQEGDTVASALHRQGVRVLGRSLKYHRPRGLYCMQGSCASCLVAVDGEPNVPSCLRPAVDGAVVESQNRIGSARRDVLAVVDKVYRNGFEPHGAFTRPRLVNEAFLKAVRFMSGLGRAPAPDTASAAARHVQKRTDVLVVGGGRHGLLAARGAAQEGLDVLLVDDGARLGGDAVWDPDQADVRALGEDLPPEIETVQGTCFGLYKDRAGLMVGSGVPDLWEVEASRVVVATGSHDAWPLFPNNDLPGVLSRRGAARLLDVHGLLPGLRIVVHGAPLPAGLQGRLEAAGAQIVAQGLVQDVRGDLQVERVQVDGTWFVADTVVCDLPGHPRAELLQQAGMRLVYRDGALRPEPGGPVEARFTEVPT